jgi:soluble lytic murein transglycosylase-like protein
MSRPHRVISARQARALRVVASLGVLALLAACASHRPANLAQRQEAEQYAAHARGNYIPPGPPDDPWGPYIQEASARFDVPDQWIRAVMHQESGGKLYHGGELVTSWAGAMGLMQVMPATYDGLHDRYNLGDDPFDPHDNIMAGAAYMREMYDIYGTPGFLAAYNAGPARLDDYLSNNRPLPDETRHYVAAIGPYIEGVYPINRSPAEQYAMNALPIDIPRGTRYGRSVQLASSRGNGGRAPYASPVQVAQLPTPPRPTAARSQTYAALALPPPPPPAVSHGGFQLIGSAYAASVPMHGYGAASGQWAIQVGAFARESQAHAALGSAKQQAHETLAVAHTTVAGVHQGHGLLYRARLTGLSRDSAVRACEKLAHSRTNCIVLSPDAQS